MRSSLIILVLLFLCFISYGKCHNEEIKHDFENESKENLKFLFDQKADCAEAYDACDSSHKCCEGLTCSEFRVCRP